jgi:hypothetical protein
MTTAKRLQRQAAITQENGTEASQAIRERHPKGANRSSGLAANENSSNHRQDNQFIQRKHTSIHPSDTNKGS